MKIRLTIHQKLTYTEWNFRFLLKNCGFPSQFKIVIDMTSIKDVIREGISFETQKPNLLS